MFWNLLRLENSESLWHIENFRNQYQHLSRSQYLSNISFKMQHNQEKQFYLLWYTCINLFLLVLPFPSLALHSVLFCHWSNPSHFSQFTLSFSVTRLTSVPTSPVSVSPNSFSLCPLLSLSLPLLSLSFPIPFLFVLFCQYPYLSHLCQSQLLFSLSSSITVPTSPISVIPMSFYLYPVLSLSLPLLSLSFPIPSIFVLFHHWSHFSHLCHSQFFFSLSSSITGPTSPISVIPSLSCSYPI